MNNDLMYILFVVCCFYFILFFLGRKLKRLETETVK